MNIVKYFIGKELLLVIRDIHQIIIETRTYMMYHVQNQKKLTKITRSGLIFFYSCILKAQRITLISPIYTFYRFIEYRMRISRCKVFV